jgi:hypothetical protein
MPPTDEEKIAFSQEVEETVEQLDISFWDALLEYCKQNNFEVEVAATLLTQNLIDKITDELHSLKLLKNRVNKLPGL